MYNLLICGKTYEQGGIIRRTVKLISETWLTEKKRNANIEQLKKDKADNDVCVGHYDGYKAIDDGEMNYNHIKYYERRWQA